MIRCRNDQHPALDVLAPFFLLCGSAPLGWMHVLIVVVLLNQHHIESYVCSIRDIHIFTLPCLRDSNPSLTKIIG